MVIISFWLVNICKLPTLVLCIIHSQGTALYCNSSQLKCRLTLTTNKLNRSTTFLSVKVLKAFENPEIIRAWFTNVFPNNLPFSTISKGLECLVCRHHFSLTEPTYHWHQVDFMLIRMNQFSLKKENNKKNHEACSNENVLESPTLSLSPSSLPSCHPSLRAEECCSFITNPSLLIWVTEVLVQWAAREVDWSVSFTPFPKRWNPAVGRTKSDAWWALEVFANLLHTPRGGCSLLNLSCAITQLIRCK